MGLSSVPSDVSLGAQDGNLLNGCSLWFSLPVGDDDSGDQGW